MGFKRDHLLTPNITGILGDLAGPYVKGVSLNCKNLSRLARPSLACPASYIEVEVRSRVSKLLPTCWSNLVDPYSTE